VNTNAHKLILALAVLFAIAAFSLAILKPDYVGGYFVLGALIFAEVALVAIWEFSRRFFPLLIIVFLWAGVDVPLNELWTSRRWFVLAIAAVAGFVLYLRERRHHFGAFHLVALFCVIAAVVSALVSSYPRIAILKALSLLMLFAYAATGARLALLGREARFCAGLLWGCEALVYVSAVFYFVFRYPVFGNPNSLGAIMGMAVTPILLWGYFVSQTVPVRRRRVLALVLAMVLLFSSYARAGIGAAAVSCVVLCLALRQYRLLAKGAAVAAAAVLLIATLSPLRTGESSSLVSQYLYKGEEEGGILGSRRPVWDRTVASIRQHPWFGTGFGTVATSYDASVSQAGSVASNRSTTHEHGNSYLAIAEWVGLLGVAPFFLLVILIASKAGQVMIWLRRTGDPYFPAVPLAAVVIAGLVHAAFEDWLFAVGYYLCIFFWSLGFMMLDVLPAPVPRFARSAAPAPLPWPGSVGAAASGQ